jgi:uncharacterized membrane protein
MILLKHRIISGLVLILLDYLWLSKFMVSKYKVMIKNIQGSRIKVNFIFIILTYFLMLMGLNLFVLPNINPKTINIYDSLRYGFLFGIVIFGIYDFTAASVFNNWDISLAIYDILWGGTLYFISSYSIKFV